MFYVHPKAPGPFEQEFEFFVEVGNKVRIERYQFEGRAASLDDSKKGEA